MEEIKSSLVNSKEFEFVKKSLIRVSEKDGKHKFRVKMLEYINDSADNDDDEFFYDMLDHVRFLDPDDKAVAYTTPDTLIFLNAPDGGGAGENARIWDFIYDHECLHQLWETFAVEEKIKEKGIEFNHYILNIASDCVINDYLMYYRKKTPLNGLITPEYLNEKYQIDYDRKKDTQYTLYLKLLEKAKELEKDQNLKDQCDDFDEGQNKNQSNNSQPGGNQGNKGDKNNKKQGDKDSQGQDSKNGQGQGGKDSKDGKDSQGQDSKNGQGQSSKDTQDDKDGQDGQGQGGKDSQDGKDGQSQDGQDGQNQGGQGWGHSSEEHDLDETPEDLKKIRESGKQIIEKYKNKISGDLGNFIKQCAMASSLKESGLIVDGTKKGTSSMWNQKMNTYIKAYLKNKVFQKQREFKRTYQKVKRGSGFIEYGQPIERGKKIKNDKLLINVAFYVDRSGSMSANLDHVFDALYYIAEALKKQFGKEKVVSDVQFKVFAFDDYLKEIKYGSKASAGGATMSFHSLLQEIDENTKDYLINVILTDAQFDINESEVNKFLKDIEGCVIFVTNENNETVKKISDNNKTKLFYILADSDFTVKQ